MRKVLVTTIPGLEDLLLEELNRLLEGKGVTRRGRVVYESTRPLRPGDLFRLASSLTLAEKIYVVLIEGRAQSLSEIRRMVVSALDDVGRFLGHSISFAVKAEREGEHPFTSIDIAREVGAAIQTLEPPPPVSLDDPDVLLHAELIGDEFRLAIDLTPFLSLRDRGYRVYIHPSSLNPVVARAMCRLARITEGGTFVDPMCGSGTIVIEGLLDAPSARGIGFDINPKHVAGARANAAAAGVAAEFGVADVRSLSNVVRGGIDAIVTNPPYGIRERAVGGLKRVYEALFSGALSTLNTGGRLVLLSPLKRLVEHAALARNWAPVHVRQLDMGGLAAYIFVFERD